MITLAYDRGTIFLEVAALTALRCRSLHRYPIAPIRTHIERYWRASKTRQYEWQSSLAAMRRDYEANENSRHPTPLLAGIMEEIFASDVLTRVWSAVVPQIGKIACPESADFIQSALVGQMEVQSRALQLLFDLPEWDGATASRLQKVRSSTERWIDLLLGYLQPCRPMDGLACNARRVHDFAATFQYGSDQQQRSTELMLAEGITASAARLFRSRCPHPQLNRRIVQSVLACLGPDLLDSVGPLAQVWQSRLVHAAVEMKYWLDKLTVEEGNLP